MHDLIIGIDCTAYSSTPDQTDSTPFVTASLTAVRPERHISRARRRHSSGGKRPTNSKFDPPPGLNTSPSPSSGP